SWIVGWRMRTIGRGTRRLSGMTLVEPLLLETSMLACEADVESHGAAVELCRRMGTTKALRAWGAVDRYPGHEVASTDELRDYVRKTAITYHHQVGTCKMGRDALAVVDPRLRVYGVEGLRVADASVMPAV